MSALLEDRPMTRQEARSLGLKSYTPTYLCCRGHEAKRGVANGRCRKCASEAVLRIRNASPESRELDRAKSRAYYASNKERARDWKKRWIAENPEQYKESRRRWRNDPVTRSREMFTAAKWSAKKKGLPFDLDRKLIEEKIRLGRCELTGAKFDLTPLTMGRQNPYTASLDRIKPELGYVKTNVRMILWGLNMALNTYGEDVYASIAKTYLRSHGERGSVLT